jgi:hypothetical protein
VINRLALIADADLDQKLSECTFINKETQTAPLLTKFSSVLYDHRRGVVVTVILNIGAAQSCA